MNRSTPIVDSGYATFISAHTQLLTIARPQVPPIRGANRLPTRSQRANPSLLSVARPLRYLPPDCPLVEVTCRTLHGRMLLRPSHRLNELVLGVLARAARCYGMGVCAFVFLANHYRAPRGANLPCGLRGPPGSAVADPRLEVPTEYRQDRRAQIRLYSAWPVRSAPSGR